jgi:hypothetical protein
MPTAWAGKDRAEVNLFATETDAAAIGDDVAAGAKLTQVAD